MADSRELVQNLFEHNSKANNHVWRYHDIPLLSCTTHEQTALCAPTLRKMARLPRKFTPKSGRHKIDYQPLFGKRSLCSSPEGLQQTVIHANLLLRLRPLMIYRGELLPYWAFSCEAQLCHPHINSVEFPFVLISGLKSTRFFNVSRTARDVLVCL